jgi:hypothetical protein
MMTIVTTSSLEHRTGPAWVEWVAANGTQQPPQQFDVVSDAIDFADKLYNDHHLRVWVRPEHGPIYHPED